MSILLRQSTAAVIKFGPLVDKEDGVTLKSDLASALDNATTGIKISKNGGTLAARHATVTETAYDAHGFYNVTLDATDTSALGRLLVCYTDPATCLAVWTECMVMPANVYDSLFGADLLEVELSAVLAAVEAIPANPLLADDARLDNLDTTVSSRLAASGYTAPDNAGIAAIRATDIPAIDAAISALDFSSVTLGLQEVTDGLEDVEDALRAARIPLYGKVWEYTCTNSATGAPVSGVRIVATTDEAGLNAVAEGYTDAFGVARLYLVPGTYYIWRFKPGFNPVNPDVEVVT